MMVPTGRIARSTTCTASASHHRCRQFHQFTPQGSTDALTDAVETSTDEWVYRAFGEVESRTGVTDNDFTYIGKLGYFQDPEIDLYFVRRRYYDPAAGRFVTEDPIGFRGGDVNLYRYTNNNPTNHVDPSGKALWTEDEDSTIVAPFIISEIERTFGYQIPWLKTDRSRFCMNRPVDVPPVRIPEAALQDLQERHRISDVHDVAAAGLEFLADAPGAAFETTSDFFRRQRLRHRVTLDFTTSFPWQLWRDMYFALLSTQEEPSPSISDDIPPPMPVVLPGGFNVERRAEQQQLAERFESFTIKEVLATPIFPVNCRRRMLRSAGPIGIHYSMDSCIIVPEAPASACGGGLGGLLCQLGSWGRQLISRALTALRNLGRVALAVLLRPFGIDVDDFFDKIGEFVGRIGEIVRAILSNPGRFFTTLFGGIGEGFRRFFANIGDYLLSGGLKWLFGGQINLPMELSLASAGTLFLDWAGATWSALRQKLLSRFGLTEQEFPRLIAGADQLRTSLRAGAIGDLLSQAKDAIQDRAFAIIDLSRTILAGSRSLLFTALIQKIPRLLTLLVPGAGFVYGIWTILQWLLSQGQRLISAFVRSISSAVPALAAGIVGRVASAFVGGLRSVLGPLLDLLTRVLGINDLPQKLGALRMRIQAWVNRKLDAIADWIARRIGIDFRRLRARTPGWCLRASRRNPPVPDVDSRNLYLVRKGLSEGQIENDVEGIRVWTLPIVDSASAVLKRQSGDTVGRQLLKLYKDEHHWVFGYSPGLSGEQKKPIFRTALESGDQKIASGARVVGHIIGQQFGGSANWVGGYENRIAPPNVFPSDENKEIAYNSQFERVWAEKLDEGKKVCVRITLSYPSGSYRPSSLTGEWWELGSNNTPVTYHPPVTQVLW